MNRLQQQQQQPENNNNNKENQIWRMIFICRSSVEILGIWRENDSIEFKNLEESSKTSRNLISWGFDSAEPLKILKNPQKS